MTDMKLNDLLKNQSPTLIYLMLLFNVLVILGVVYVALDARERGAKKEVSFFWALGVGLFPPVFFLYLFYRLITGRRVTPSDRAAGPARQVKICPYCSGSVVEGEKICRNCGRLL